MEKERIRGITGERLEKVWAVMLDRLSFQEILLMGSYIENKLHEGDIEAIGVSKNDFADLLSGFRGLIHGRFQDIVSDINDPDFKKKADELAECREKLKKITEIVDSVPDDIDNGGITISRRKGGNRFVWKSSEGASICAERIADIKELIHGVKEESK